MEIGIPIKIILAKFSKLLHVYLVLRVRCSYSYRAANSFGHFHDSGHSEKIVWTNTIAKTYIPQICI